MSDHLHCADYARANRGLPAVEAGMPVPAGTGLSRRGFLLRSAGVALSVYGADRLAPQVLEEGVAMAQATGPQPVLVSIFLSGGIDALSVLAPYEDPKYRALEFWGRPSLTPETRAELERFAVASVPAVLHDWEQAAMRAMRQNALRHLIATSPDYQTS